MRERCKILVAVGDCAVFGGVCTMRNFFNKDEVLRRGYVRSESTIDGKIPISSTLNSLLENVKTVDEVVEVDVYLPGCPPDADAIYFVLSELIEGRIPKLTAENLRYD
jgi:NAD-reducing hydrogenase small subunit